MMRGVSTSVFCIFFFFQAEDGIRDVAVTGVQTCALPISDQHARPPGGSAVGRRGRSRRPALPHHRQPRPERARLRRQGDGDPEAGRPRADRDVRRRRLGPAGRSVGRGARAGPPGGRRMTRSLEDRIAIGTGAAKGMGREVCLALAREGAHLVLAAREVAPLQALAREIEPLGRRALAEPTDVTDEAAVRTLVERTLATFGGRIDILVNGAGVTGPIETPVWEITGDDWDHVLAVNLRGTFLPTKHVLPTMIAQRDG